MTLLVLETSPRLTTDGQLITFSPPIVSMEGSSDVNFLASGTRADTTAKSLRSSYCILKPPPKFWWQQQCILKLLKGLYGSSYCLCHRHHTRNQHCLHISQDLLSEPWRATGFDYGLLFSFGQWCIITHWLVSLQKMVNQDFQLENLYLASHDNRPF